MSFAEEAYWNDLADALDRAEREAMESAQLAADLWEFDTEEERAAYVEKEFETEYSRLVALYEETL